MRMRENWYPRLIEMIEADSRSLAQLSALLGRGQNYVQQMIRNDKEPGADKVAKLLEVLGSDAALYVMTGIKIDHRDLELLELMKRLPDDARDRAAEFFHALLDREGKTGLPASDTSPSFAKE